MDEFKKYLFEHRDELDNEKPPRPQVWKHIRQQTQVAKKPVIPLIIKWSAAAAAVLIITSVFVYQLQRPEKPEGPQLSANNDTNPKTTKAPEAIGQVDSSAGTASMQQNEENSTELPGDKTADNTIAPRKTTTKDKKRNTKKPSSPLQAIEDNYATLINYQVQKLETTPIHTESAGYFHAFKKQWLDLEKDEHKVKQDVRLYGLNDHIVGKLTRLYQQKLWLLEELQTEINKMNELAQQHPDIKRSKPAYLKL